MNRLSKEVYKEYQTYPEKVLQFGTGNFLRAFTDWMVDKMNKEADFDGSIVVVQSTNSGTAQKINRQDGLYTLYLQGIVNGKPIREHEVINSVSRALNINEQYDEYIKLATCPDLRFVISNTTEAGIVYDGNDQLEDQPQSSFVGKLTAFLYERFKQFSGDHNKGLIIIPCELIDENGKKLKEIVHQYAHAWNLETPFIKWIDQANYFCNSLVDRIVSGYPKDEIKEITEELRFEDELVVIGEQYHLWAIEGPEFLRDEFPAEKLGLNVKVVNDLAPYRDSKVYVLNGAHTAMTPVAFLYGLKTVGQAMENSDTRTFVEKLIFDEIIPGTDLPELETRDFANDVLDRFSNPYVQHYLLSISLNAMSKFKVRNVPVLLSYVKKHQTVPKRIAFALAAWIAFFKGKRGDELIELADDEYILTYFQEQWSSYNHCESGIERLVENILGFEKLWDYNLNEIHGLPELVVKYLSAIENKGMKKALEILAK